MKKLLLLILCALAGLVAAFSTQRIYDNKLDPELAFFRRAAEKSDAWEATVRADGQPVYIFAGGSDVRMSINPKVMLKHGVRAINAGNAASMGMHSNAAIALAHVRKGDTLVLSLYSNKMPDNNKEDEYDLSANGLKMNFQRRGWDMFKDGITPLNTRVLGDLFRGTARDWCVYVSKKLLRPDQMFKYDKDAELHESGWVEVKTRAFEHKATVPAGHSCNVAFPDITKPEQPLVEYIAQVKRACDERGVELAVYLPRHFMADCQCTRAQYALMALCYTRMGVRVIRDDTFGLQDDNRLFADTELHLSPEGTELNSRILAEILSAQDEADRYWTEEGLIRHLEDIGWVWSPEHNLWLPLRRVPGY